jgi:PiT family inorganic phosphate transporter
MATSVGSKAITIKQAIFIAAIFEFLGAWLAGGQVTKTIRKGIIDVGALDGSPEILVFGMLAALLAAGTWLLIASFKGWPVSTTHSIVGAIVGFAVVGIGVDAVHWDKIGEIAMSWVVSPMLSGFIAYTLFISIQNLIFNAPDPLAAAKKYVPFYIFAVGFMIGLVTMLKGLKHVGLDLTTAESYAIATVIGVITMIVGKYLISKLKFEEKENDRFHFTSVEKIFAILMVFTACAMAFAHGSNDVANAVGPVAAIVGIVEAGGQMAQKSAMPVWILLMGGVGIVVGLSMYGYKVMATVGGDITELTPSRGFAATLAAATTVVLASGTGLPISTTHTLVGAILGVGLARGIGALNLKVIGNIFMSWVVTLPAGGILAIIFFYMIQGAFS